MMNASRIASLTGFRPQAFLTNNASVLVVTMVLRNFLRFFSNAVLTRFLAPEAFGVMLVVGSVQFVLAVLSETGVNAFLIRTPHAKTPSYLNVLWTVSLLRGTALGLILFVFAPQFAQLMGAPETALALRVVAVTFLFQGIKSLAPIVTRRDGAERKNAVIALGVGVAQLPITIGLAYLLGNYWALVIGMVAASFFTMVSSYAFYKAPWHRLRLDRAILAELWTFTRFIIGSTVVTVVVMQFDKIFVTNTLPLSVVGLYGMAWTMANVAEQFVLSYFKTVFMPDVAKAQRRGKTGPDVYYTPMRFIRPLILFGCAGGITCGQAFFDIAFDERFLQAGAFFSILAIKPLINAFSQSSQAYLMACGNTKTKLISDLMRLAWLPAAAYFGYRSFGVWGILSAVALIDLFPALYQNALLARQGILRPVKELPSLLAIPAGAGVGALVSAAWYAIS